MSWRGAQAMLLRQRDLKVPSDVVEHAVSLHGAQEWFVYAHARRRERKHVWWPSFWLALRLRSSSPILESGCGCGLNLLWFAEHGFTSLHGFDLDGKAIAAGREILWSARAAAHLWIDNGLSPTFPAMGQFDAILALNWTYHVEEFDLSTFLRNYRTHINPGGYLVVDLIDSSYNAIPNNRYLTSDWDKPEALRRPTEYKTRHSVLDVRRCAEACGLRLVRTLLLSHNNKRLVPRRVCIFRQNT